jgi:hypothetical protein
LQTQRNVGPRGGVASNVLPELLAEAEEVCFDDEADGGAGTEVFGGFEEGGGVENEVADVDSGGGEARIDAVEAAEDVVIDSIVGGILGGSAVHGFGEVEWLFGGGALYEVSMS